ARNSSQPWRKLLWVKQPYPDNYVDWSFLSRLERNSHVKRYNFSTLSIAATALIVHCSTVLTFVGAFWCIYNNILTASSVAAVSSISILACLMLVSDVNEVLSFRSAITMVITILALSPILKSLSQSTSSDSIWSITGWLLLANICLNDYGAPSNIRSSLATNIAFSAAIVLASRLGSSLSVFCFILFSLELFGLIPLISKTFSKTSYWIEYVLTFWLISTAFAYTMGGQLLVLFWMLISFTATVIAPLWLIRLQKYKNQINGPWDPAKP
ncbi:hypothetical protein CANCADRAFT_17602, partial [Tortispora caseinolytica NRRL Y-17796]